MCSWPKLPSTTMAEGGFSDSIDEESQIVTQIYSNQRSLTRHAYEWLSKNPNHTQSEIQTASELFTSYNQSVAKVRVVPVS